MMEVDSAATTAGDDLRRLLAATLSPDKATVDAAAAGLDRVAAADPRFPLAILAVAAAGALPPSLSSLLPQSNPLATNRSVLA